MFQMNQNPLFNMWLQSMQSFMPALGNVCQPMAQPQQTNPFALMQQNIQMWQQMWAPQAAQPEFPAPKITVMTIELGDMKPYMEAANAMLQSWQPMLTNMLNDNMRKVGGWK